MPSLSWRDRGVSRRGPCGPSRIPSLHGPRRPAPLESRLPILQAWPPVFRVSFDPTSAPLRGVRGPWFECPFWPPRLCAIRSWIGVPSPLVQAPSLASSGPRFVPRSRQPTLSLASRRGLLPCVVPAVLHRSSQGQPCTDGLRQRGPRPPSFVPSARPQSRSPGLPDGGVRPPATSDSPRWRRSWSSRSSDALRVDPARRDACPTRPGRISELARSLSGPSIEPRDRRFASPTSPPSLGVRAGPEWFVRLQPWICHPRSFPVGRVRVLVPGTPSRRPEPPSRAGQAPSPAGSIPDPSDGAASPSHPGPMHFVRGAAPAIQGPYSVCGGPILGSPVHSPSRSDFEPPPGPLRETWSGGFLHPVASSGASIPFSSRARAVGALLPRPARPTQGPALAWLAPRVHGLELGLPSAPHRDRGCALRPSRRPAL